MNSAEDAQIVIPKKEPRHFLLTSIEKKYFSMKNLL